MHAAWLLLPIAGACTVVIDSTMLDDGVCDEGFKACGEVCRPDNLVEVGCGANTCTPCALPNARQRCGPAGECAIATCEGGFMDCDLVNENGCEADTLFDPNTCGECGRTCDVPGAVPDCASGRCAIRVCDVGLADCNESVVDGCEVDLSADEAHCGRCGNICASGICDTGECIP